MESALCIDPLRLARDNQDSRARIFRSELFDPEKTVPIFEKRLNQQNVRLVLSNQFGGIEEAMCAANNAVSFVARDDRFQARFADASVTDDENAKRLTFT